MSASAWLVAVFWLGLIVAAVGVLTVGWLIVVGGAAMVGSFCGIAWGRR